MAEPAYKDPSTHVNIMTDKHTQGDAEDDRNKRKEKDLSHHTFFIENSQMRLKLVARTEVRVPSLYVESKLNYNTETN
jgi:phospholipase D1/2